MLRIGPDPKHDTGLQGTQVHLTVGRDKDTPSRPEKARMRQRRWRDGEMERVKCILAINRIFEHFASTPKNPAEIGFILPSLCSTLDELN